LGTGGKNRIHLIVCPLPPLLACRDSRHSGGLFAFNSLGLTAYRVSASSRLPGRGRSGL